jgi:hypothetical protein
MSTQTASKAKLDFDRALDALNALADYANQVREKPPTNVPGMTARAAELLARPGGRDVAKTWALIFKDTIRLANKFKDEDLAATPEPDDKEIARVTQAILKTTAALTDRLDGLA